MRSLFAAALLSCFVPASLLAGDDNLYRRAKVGDWVEYKWTSKDWRGPAWEGRVKMTVIAKDDKELTYEVAGVYWIAGKEPTNTPATPAVVEKIKIDLTKPHDPRAHVALYYFKRAHIRLHFLREPNKRQ
jgi:hypothetical protein